MKPVVLSALLLSAPLIADEQPALVDPAVHSESNGDEDPTSRIVSDPAGQAYFPKDKGSYYTHYYRAAGLPSLREKHLGQDVVCFRLAFLPSFAKPIFLSYSRDDTGGAISIVRLSGRLVHGEGPGKVELSGLVRLPPEVAKYFEGAVTEPDVRAPLRHLTDWQQLVLEGADGVRWILEVRTARDYTMADPQSPDSISEMDEETKKRLDFPKVDLKEFVSFCEAVLTAADMEIPSRDSKTPPRG